MRIIPILLVSALLAGCAGLSPRGLNDEAGSPDRRMESPSPRGFSARTAAPATYVYHGNVVIRDIAPSHVAVLLDGGLEPGANDGVIDRVFVLQRDGYVR